MQTKELAFIFKTSFLYGVIAVIFSAISLFYPSTVTEVVGNPLVVSSISVEHVMGHIVWGLAVGIVSLRLRYFIIGGLFPIILDADHLIQFFDLEMISRMAHSIPFGIVAAIVLVLFFEKRDYRLGAIAFASVLSHVSFDIFFGNTARFPLFSPFIVEKITLHGIDWIIIEAIAIAIVAIISVLTRKESKSIAAK